MRRRPRPLCRIGLDARFNSRLREEATFLQAAFFSDYEVSTHASVRRRRLRETIERVVGRSFNSRLREEATTPARRAAWPRSGFNSRLREEATVNRKERATNQKVSTHASVRRRPTRPQAEQGRHGFNSRLREEATGGVPEVCRAEEFQLTPP